MRLLIIINTNKIHVGEHYMNDAELHELQKKITNVRLEIKELNEELHDKALYLTELEELLEETLKKHNKH